MQETIQRRVRVHEVLLETGKIFTRVIYFILVMSLILAGIKFVHGDTDYFNAHNQSMPSSGAQTNQIGMNFSFTQSGKVILIEKNTVMTSTTCYVYDKNTVLMGSGTFTGNACNLNASVVAGNYYYLVVDSGGAGYTQNYASSTPNINPINDTSGAWIVSVIYAGGWIPLLSGMNWGVYGVVNFTLRVPPPIYLNISLNNSWLGNDSIAFTIGVSSSTSVLYNISRNGTLIFSNSSTNYFNDTGLISNTSYFYSVVAWNDSVNSVNTTNFTLSTTVSPPQAINTTQILKDYEAIRREIQMFTEYFVFLVLYLVAGWFAFYGDDVIKRTAGILSLAGLQSMTALLLDLTIFTSDIELLSLIQLSLYIMSGVTALLGIVHLMMGTIFTDNTSKKRPKNSIDYEIYD